MPGPDDLVHLGPIGSFVIGLGGAMTGEDEFNIREPLPESAYDIDEVVP
jgi:hypothetical protein